MSEYLSEASDQRPNNSDTVPLGQILGVEAPSSPKNAPPVFNFQRRRNVEIDWRAVANPQAANAEKANTPKVGVGADFLRYFKTSWQDGQIRTESLPASDIPPIYQGNLAPPAKPLADKPWVFDANSPKSTDGKIKAIQRDKGVYVHNGQNGRLYRLIPKVKTLDLTIDVLGADPAWETIGGVELVFLTEAEAETYCMKFSEIDLRPHVIANRYAELVVMKDFSDSLGKELAKPITDQVTALLKTMDLDGLTELQSKYSELRLNGVHVDQELNRLASIASNMGLLLCLDPDSPALAGQSAANAGKAVKFVKGGVYKPIKPSARWNQYYLERPDLLADCFDPFFWSFDFFFWGFIQLREVTIDYTPIDTNVDALNQWRTSYVNANPKNEIFVMRQNGGSFVSEGGQSIGAIMQRCELSEDFRRQCVVVLPVYENSFTGDRALVKHHIFEHPLPGMIATTLPKLSIQESLTYRMVWSGSAIGELVSTINLAPGERRTVHLERQYQSETSVTHSSTSVFDVSSNDSNEFSDEMERTVRHEQATSENLQTSASTSGGFLGESGSASASAGVDHSSKDFAQAISNVAKKTAQAITRNNRQDISVTDSSRTTVSVTSETASEIHNINQGRTLNLMFHRLYNRYNGGVYVEDLNFSLIPGVELIAGSGIYAETGYSLGGFDHMMKHLQKVKLPFEISDAGRQELRRVVMLQICRLLNTEYALPEKSGSGESASSEQSTSIEVLSFVPILHDIAKGLTNTGLTEKDMNETQAVIDAVLKGCSTNIKSTQIIEQIELMVGSRGVYMDSQVGEMPATEHYSELMRDREIRMRDAEIFKEQSSGQMQYAQARRITNIVGQSGDIWLTTVDYDLRNWTSVQIGLNTLIPPGDWQLTLDDRVVSEHAADTSQDYVFRFEWPVSQKHWLDTPGLTARVAIREKSTGQEFRFGQI